MSEHATIAETITHTRDFDRDHVDTNTVAATMVADLRGLIEAAGHSTDDYGDVTLSIDNADVPSNTVTLVAEARPRTTQIPAVIPLGGDTFTVEALERLVGQEPRLTIDGDWKASLGRAKVVSAIEHDGTLALQLEVPNSTVIRLGKASLNGIGFRLRQARVINDQMDREFEDIELAEVVAKP